VAVIMSLTEKSCKNYIG